MIAPIRHSAETAYFGSSGALRSGGAAAEPQHIGQLVSLVLARYGITMTPEELAAFRPTGKSKAAAFRGQRQFASGQRHAARAISQKATSRHSTPLHPKTGKLVQLPLFATTSPAAADVLAVR